MIARQGPDRHLHWRVPRLEPALGYALVAVAMLWVFERLPDVWAV